MDDPGVQGGCWPTEHEELLLTAALGPAAEALAAWDRWRAAVDLEQADLSAHTLLPLVYRRLRAHGVEERSLARLRSVYRRQWYLNQVLLDCAATTVQAFEAAGIKTLLLKGAALVTRYYRDVGARRMKDVDLLVPRDRAHAAIALLRDLGWSPRDPSPERFVQSRHARSFVHESGRKLDLHWHALWECWWPGVDDGFWRAAVPLRLGEAAALALSPGDELLHACAHGVAWNRETPVRWVADAMTVVQDGLTVADWEWLVVQARGLRMTLPVLAGLRYLRERWDAAVPEEVLRVLAAAPVSTVERRVYEARTSPPRPVLGYAPLVAYRYFLAFDGVTPTNVWGFPRYVQRYIGLDRLSDVPGYSAAWIGERAVRAWRGRVGR